MAVGHFPGSFTKISRLTEITFIKSYQKSRKSKVLVNSISRGVRRWLMANPGSDPRFFESWIDGCTEKAPVCSLSDRCCKLLATGIQIDQINITI